MFGIIFRENVYCNISAPPQGRILRENSDYRYRGTRWQNQNNANKKKEPPPPSTRHQRFLRPKDSWVVLLFPLVSAGGGSAPAPVRLIVVVGATRNEQTAFHHDIAEIAHAKANLLVLPSSPFVSLLGYR